mmetsp:Transcript_18265/g.33782  ORF Transcript_18265/g.33782 Transcript_18265/m.33782 type:complete len:358 (+) Transcript_18265:82-1155(+)
MTENETLDDRLDVCSKTFNPELALERGAKLPCKVYPLENLNAARILLPSSHADALTKEERARRHKAAAFRLSHGEERAKKAAVEREARRKLRQQEALAFVNPIDAIMNRFQEGPLSLLYHCAKNKARVKVTLRRIDGIRGTLTGILRSFDKHWNMILIDAEEEYKVYEYIKVSADGFKSTTELKLKKFFQVYCPEKAENAGVIAQKYHGRDAQLWEFLHKRYGLLERVEEELVRGIGHREHNEVTEKATKMLLAYAGREPVLMRKLGIANESESVAKFGNQASNLGDAETVVYAEWVRKESIQYPGKFFFFNAKTKESRWTPPRGVIWKELRYLVTKKRFLMQTLVRGDNVIMVAKF